MFCSYFFLKITLSIIQSDKPSTILSFSFPFGLEVITVHISRTLHFSVYCLTCLTRLTFANVICRILNVEKEKKN